MNFRINTLLFVGLLAVAMQVLSMSYDDESGEELSIVLARRLRDAIIMDDVKGAKEALAGGADTKRVVGGTNAFGWAERSRNPEIQELFGIGPKKVSAAPAKAKVKGPVSKNSPLAELLYANVITDDLNGVKEALAAGADVNERVHGKTAVEWARDNDLKEILEVLEGNPVDVLPKAPGGPVDKFQSF